MKMKSVMAGEYTAPPAHGPMTSETWGTTPEASTLRWNTSAYPPSEATPSWMRAAGVVQADDRGAHLHRVVHDLDSSSNGRPDLPGAERTCGSSRRYPPTRGEAVVSIERRFDISLVASAMADTLLRPEAIAKRTAW